MLAICAPRGRIILLTDYGNKATYSKNFLISAFFTYHILPQQQTFDKVFFTIILSNNKKPTAGAE